MATFPAKISKAPINAHGNINKKADNPTEIQFSSLLWA
nr:MAG TPA: hypothetical protein [Caudoviricetes sp.]